MLMPRCFSLDVYADGFIAAAAADAIIFRFIDVATPC